MKNSKAIRAKILFIAVPIISKVFFTLIGITCRTQWHGKEHLDALKGKAWIGGFWHDNVPISCWTFRNRNITAMVSESRDGEYVTRISNVFGNNTVRGSSSSNSTKATRALLKILKNKQPTGITPDGPRGPRYQLQKGILTLSALSNSPIVPIHLEATRQWRFKSWDKQKLCKPFAKIYVCIGEPYTVDREQLHSNPDEVLEIVQQKMLDNAWRAKKLAGVTD